MIIKFEPPEADGGAFDDNKKKWYWSSFDRGKVELIVFGGHGEYPLDAIVRQVSTESRPLYVMVRDAYDVEDSGYDPQWWKDNKEAILKKYPDANEWGHTYCIYGDVGLLWKAFYQFAMSLDPAYDPAGYTPGGDDDSFDYWPAAFECLNELGKDLQELTNRLPDEWHKANQNVMRALIPPRDRCHHVYHSLVVRLYPLTLPDEQLDAAWAILEGTWES